MNMQKNLLTLLVGVGLAAASPSQEQRAQVTTVITVTDVSTGEHVQMMCAPIQATPTVYNFK